jgi:hypothetical protein
MRYLAALILLVPFAAKADAAADMAKAAEGFYAAYATFHPSDGIPDAKGRAKYAPYVSPRLETLLADGDAAEDRFAKKNKDSPPLIEGDLFTSNFEGATSVRVTACRGDANKGTCSAALTYDDRSANPKDKPVTWIDTVYLVAAPGGWRVDDVGYGASWDFGNKGKMSDTLKGAIADAGD